MITERKAELAMAVAMACFSIYLMLKSAELPIGWIPDEGPGGGAFPFWLASGMLICCVLIILRWLRGISPLSRSYKPYLSATVLRLVLISGGSLGIMVALIHFIGVYGAIPLFMIFYMRVLGDHSWWVTLVIGISTPILTFLFFELALTITLPKGYTEPLFYPIYDLFY